MHTHICTMYIFNTYKCSKTTCKRKEENEPGFKSMLDYHRWGKAAGRWNEEKGKHMVRCKSLCGF